MLYIFESLDTVRKAMPSLLSRNRIILNQKRVSIQQHHNDTANLLIYVAGIATACERNKWLVEPLTRNPTNQPL